MWQNENVVDIDVSLSGIRAGAQQISSIADDVSLASDASIQALSPSAFGLLCSPLLLPPYLGVGGAAMGMITSAAERERRIAEDLREMATEYEEADNSIGRTFNTMERSI